jgi:hypothetical protein
VPAKTGVSAVKCTGQIIEIKKGVRIGRWAKKINEIKNPGKS